MLQRIHRQYVRYESALDDTLIGIEHLNYGYLTHHKLDPKTRYLEAVEEAQHSNQYSQMYTSTTVTR